MSLIRGIFWEEKGLFETKWTKRQRISTYSMEGSFGSLWMRGLYELLCVVVSVFLLALIRAGDFFIFLLHPLRLSSKVL